jgi:photosystem I subunit 9
LLASPALHALIPPASLTSKTMKKFLTTAPVFSAIWFTITAVIMIEFNHLFPDMLFSPF